MARIICLDIGGKRTGLAVTDPMQIIATGLDTIDARELITFLKKYSRLISMASKNSVKSISSRYS
ncbi:MAG: Holliday junction resolvase RuvX [Sphingobacteriales bacterium]|nr:MAG: Holliday junction resolvase RuvX [Sphingobacteriales bacterium]